MKKLLWLAIPLVVVSCRKNPVERDLYENGKVNIGTYSLTTYNILHILLLHIIFLKAVQSIL